MVQYNWTCLWSENCSYYGLSCIFWWEDPLLPWTDVFFNEGNEKIYCALNCFVSLALSWVLNVASPPFFALLPLTAAAVKFLQHLHNYESESLNKLLRVGCTICCDMFGVARLFAMSLHTEAANTQLDILGCSKLISQAPDILKGAKCFGCVTEMTNKSFVMRYLWGYIETYLEKYFYKHSARLVMAGSSWWASRCVAMNQVTTIHDNILLMIIMMVMLLLPICWIDTFLLREGWVLILKPQLIAMNIWGIWCWFCFLQILRLHYWQSHWSVWLFSDHRPDDI